MDTDEKLEITRILKEMRIFITRTDGQDLLDWQAVKFANAHIVKDHWFFQEVVRTAYNQVVVIYEQ